MKRSILAATAAISMLLGAPLAQADEDVKFEDLPAPVKQTVQRETRGGQITDIERQRDRNSVYYEIEYTVGNQDWELDIAPDGKLLRREKD